MGLKGSEGQKDQACLPKGSQNAEEIEKGVIEEQFETNEDHFEKILDEWKSAKDFNLSTFLTRLFLAAFAVFSLASDSLLFVEYLRQGLESDANRTETRFRPNPLLTKSNGQNNRMYGILTLLIQFLPGIQWYTSITTKHKLLRFLTTIFFPFFTVIFKVTVLMMTITFSLFSARRCLPPRTEDCRDSPKVVLF